MADPFVEGVEAYDRYESRDDNPYDPTSNEHFAWNHGYSERKNGYVDEDGWYYEND